MTENILKLVAEERARQDVKWGEQNHNPAFWAVILGEEYGEVCRAIFENDPSQYVAELIQLAAVCVAMVEAHQRQYAAPKDEVQPAYKLSQRLQSGIIYARKMLNEYKGIGAPGHFGVMRIQQQIESAERLLRCDAPREAIIEMCNELEAIA